MPRILSPVLSEGWKACSGQGILAGFPVVNMTISFINDMYHNISSWCRSSRSRREQPSAEALRKAESVLLEPIMKVEVLMHNDMPPPSLSNLNLQHRQIPGRNMRENRTSSNAIVPLVDVRLRLIPYA